jgi:SAM-dependent methyltransferase
LQKQDLLAYYRAQTVDRERMYTKPFRRYQQRRRLEVVRSCLQKIWGGGHIVDVGCGDGYGSSMVLAGMDCDMFVGVDLSAEKLRLACRNLTACLGILGDAERLPFCSRIFDLALSLETLEHLLDPYSALREIARILKPGGSFLLSVPVSSRFNTAISRGLMKFRRRTKFREHLQIYTLESVLSLLRTAGLRPIGYRFCVFNYPCYEILTRLIPYRLWRRLDELLSRWTIGIMGVKLGFSFALGNDYLVVAARREGGRSSV